jgi:hypothetical protein
MVGGVQQITVRNPSPSLGSSGAVPLSVQNPAPVLHAIEPGALAFNGSSGSSSVTLRGENFVSSSMFELTPPCASVFSTHRIDGETATLSINLQCAGMYSVRVRTPQPGGGDSQTLTITVN